MIATTDTDDGIDSRHDYRGHIEFTADCLLDEYEPGEDELTELVFESADSDVIYTSHCLDVLYHSETQPDEWHHLVSDGSSWQEVVQAMAFDIVRQDLWAEIERRDVNTE